MIKNLADFILLYYSHEILHNTFFTILFQCIFVFFLMIIILSLLLSEIYKKRIGYERN